MVRLKIAYWEFDFKAVCPTLDHDLLSQAHIYIYIYTELEPHTLGQGLTLNWGMMH